MKRFLRVAFSATCLIACVLLIVLWVRSYYWEITSNPPPPPRDSIDVVDWDMRMLGFRSQNGAITVSITNYDVSGKWTQVFPPGRILGFDAETYGKCRAIRIPYWFLVPLSAILATLPWLRWRFGLRTLLITTTLVAVVLGLAVYASRK